MRPLTAMLTAIAAGALTFTSSGELGVRALRAAVPAPSQTAARSGHAGPSCNIVSLKEISAVLGVRVSKPSVTVNGPVTVCEFGVGGRDSLMVRFATGESRHKFQQARKGFDKNGEPTKTVTGLKLPAYSGVLNFAWGKAENTLVVLKGSTELLMTSTQFELPKLVALAKKILPRM